MASLSSASLLARAERASRSRAFPATSAALALSLTSLVVTLTGCTSPAGEDETLPAMRLLMGQQPVEVNLGYDPNILEQTPEIVFDESVVRATMHSGMRNGKHVWFALLEGVSPGATRVTFLLSTYTFPLTLFLRIHIDVEVLVDSDGDGVGDNYDGCPSDAAKSTPGACGCGVPDVDMNDDLTADCLEAGAVNVIVEVWQNGTATAGARVEVRQASCSYGEPLCTGLTGPDGRFTCPDVSVGQTLCIEARCCAPAEMVGGASRDVIDPGDGAMLVRIDIAGT